MTFYIIAPFFYDLSSTTSTGSTTSSTTSTSSISTSSTSRTSTSTSTTSTNTTNTTSSSSTTSTSTSATIAKDIVHIATSVIRSSWVQLWYTCTICEVVYIAFRSGTIFRKSHKSTPL